MGNYVYFYRCFSRRSKINLRNLINQLMKWYGNLSLYNYHYPVNKVKGNKIKNTITCPFCGNKMKLVEIYCPIDYG
ncbi:MAG: hypothetical protein ACTSRG_01775 [Candidatus Helarchaeota archaeon]